MILDNIQNLIQEAVKINFSKLKKPARGATKFIAKLHEEKKVQNKLAAQKYPELDIAKKVINLNRQDLRNGVS